MGELEVLDPSALEVLRPLTPPGEPDILTEVLRMFLSEVPPRLERLRNAWAAGNIGARAFFAVCSQLDEKGKAGDLAGAAPLVDAVGAEFGRVEAAIHRLRGA